MNSARRTRALAAMQPHIERARTMSGWAHAGLAVRRIDRGPPWDYEKDAQERAAHGGSVLDMGTGGGEVLARVSAGSGARFVATEEWVVNVPVAHKRLAPLGIDVLHASSRRLPFRDASFALVLNRHEELDPAEVARVLRPGGAVLTQQFGPNAWPELDGFFPGRHDFGDLFAEYRDGFAAAGLEVRRAERHGERVAFATLGDLVYLMLVTPWDVIGFDPVADIDALLALEDQCGTADGIVLTESHFFIEAARRP